MARPKKRAYSLAEKLALIGEAGIKKADNKSTKLQGLNTLQDRINALLNIVKDKPIKATEMTYLIMYDISNDKVRTQIAKYLLNQGCVRIQRSVFIVKTKNQNFEEIHDTLKEVNEYYQNEDSIILVPINASDARSMKLIGKNVHISTITDKPNTLFF